MSLKIIPKSGGMSLKNHRAASPKLELIRHAMTAFFPPFSRGPGGFCLSRRVCSFEIPLTPDESPLIFRSESARNKNKLKVLQLEMARIYSLLVTRKGNKCVP